jgi:ribosomal protein L11 methyltransferase
MTRRHASALETVSVVVPAAAVGAYEAAIGGTCGSVGLFHDEAADLWTVEGVKDRGAGDAELAAALALAALLSGVEATARRHATAAEGWLERTRAAFPEQLVGRRFAIRGAHIRTPRAPGRVTLVLDASVAFGSGEHGSTRGCLRALERLAHRRPRRVLDLGTGSGILALAAARLLRRPVLGSDIDPWSVRTARANAKANRLAPRVRCVRADGWTSPAIAGGGPYDLVLANILARPLVRLARKLARHLAPGGRAVLAGLLTTQARWVLAAHRCHGLVLERRLAEGNWCTLVLRR